MSEAAQSITAEDVAAAIGRPVAMVRRRKWDYHSSHPMQELQVELKDGSTFPLLFKDLNPFHELDQAKRTRPGFVYNPRREIDVYRDVLSRLSMDSPRFYGAAVDERAEPERYWLFLECVRGIPLWQCELDLWSEAARWLRRLHAARPAELPRCRQFSVSPSAIMCAPSLVSHSARISTAAR